MGRAPLLSFMGRLRRRAGRELDFTSIDDDYESLSEDHGGYVLMAGGRTTWAYPWGRSPVFYIGKAEKSTLRDRLWDHWKAAGNAKKSDGDSLWYAVSHYAAEFNPRYVVVPTWQGMTPDSIEKELIGRFVAHYGARPIANSQTRWDRT